MGRAFSKMNTMRGHDDSSSVGECGRVRMKGQGHSDLREKYARRDRGNRRWCQSVP